MTSLENPGAPYAMWQLLFRVTVKPQQPDPKVTDFDSLDFPPIWSRALLLVSANSANGCAGAESEGAPREHVLSSVDGQNGSKWMV